MSYFYHLSLEDVLDGISEGLELANHRFPIQARLIVSKSRDLNSDTMGRPWPTDDEIVELAIRYHDRGVVGLDLSGQESGYPPELFRSMFQRARDAGLGITVHAGEAAGAESVRVAVETLGATRIGHGVRVVEDLELVKQIANMGVVLEICPTSNLYTGAVSSLQEHPVRRLCDAGVQVTISTDDPSVCKTTLTDEYLLLAKQFGFTLDEILQLNQNAFNARFDR
jgi:adenosine deaminase